MISRRAVVAQGLTLLGTASLARPGLAAALHLASDPFRLGVASGFPTDHSVVLWTRLAPDPLAADGGMPPVDIEVRWELSSDEQFRRIVARGRVVAQASAAHSCRAVANGLSPARHYWYRFTASGHRSRVGRTRTLQNDDAATAHLAVVSCQHYEHGHFAALRHIAASAPDLVVHLGDYIYEGAPSQGRLRTHTAGLCRTLTDYRLRYAQYQMDPALQEAHAAAPWLCTWDDHEVANDYSGLVSGRSEDPAIFLARRTAAYQAWFEHLPLPPQAAPGESETLIYARRRYGTLATVHMLDQRQYRSPQACPAADRAGGNRINDACQERLLATRSMLGATQESWLAEGLMRDRGKWTLIAQGTVMSHINEAPDTGGLYWSDAWNGYPAARSRLLASLQRTRSANPIILSGDLHAFLVGSINEIPERLDSPIVAAEFTTTSLSSDGRSQEQLDQWRSLNGNLQLLEGRQRGYLQLKLHRDRAEARLFALDDVSDPQSGQRVLHSFAIEADRPGIHPA